jgi:hypothetical protein
MLLCEVDQALEHVALPTATFASAKTKHLLNAT